MVHPSHREPAPDSPWASEKLEALSARFANASPRELLAWGYETFGDQMVMATGFGPSGIVLMHIVSELRSDATVFFVDTDILFPETYALREELEARLGIEIRRVHSELTLQQQAERYGPELWRSNPNLCCFLRKVAPLRSFLADKAAWVTGLRRDQSEGRAATALLEWDASNGLVKLNPLAHWTEEEVWGYIQLHNLPYNTLHDQGYPSLGCVPCTDAVAPGEDARAGRWRGHAKTECGIHEAETVASRLAS